MVQHASKWCKTWGLVELYVISVVLLCMTYITHSLMIRFTCLRIVPHLGSSENVPAKIAPMGAKDEFPCPSELNWIQ